MLVAQKKHLYESYDYLDKKEQPNTKNTRRKNKRKNLFIKISAIFWIMTISAAFIVILLRYTAITEAEYRIYSLNKEITKLEDHLRDVNVKFDGLSRSDIIEEAAARDLNMQYPQYQQMVFLNLDNAPELDLAVIDEYNPSNDEIINRQSKDKRLVDYVKVSFKKLYSLLD